MINDWWGGRQMADMLPRLFFDHFQNTSFIAEEDGQLIAFFEIEQIAKEYDGRGNDRVIFVKMI